MFETRAQPWARDAECLSSHPKLFFPARGESTVAAKKVCAGCPVRSECLAYALDEGIKFGVWGGKSERERRTMRRRIRETEAVA
jgi:WhiB family transcriptional regulator, redox-sensing transcriptional regulator